MEWEFWTSIQSFIVTLNYFFSSFARTTTALIVTSSTANEIPIENSKKLRHQCHLSHNYNYYRTWYQIPFSRKI